MPLKRLFFGLEVYAPWSFGCDGLAHPLAGRILAEEQRHLTLAFLGNVDCTQVEVALSDFPPPPFRLGRIGKFDQCLFLPPKTPRVVAWHVLWLDPEPKQVEHYYEALHIWLKEKGLLLSHLRPFLPHVTLCRAPFPPRKWKQTFIQLPLMTGSLHLYESLGNCCYIPLWSYPLLLPFEERAHTADLAYLIRGENYSQLLEHGSTALAFHFPPLLSYLSSPITPPSNLDEVIIALNERLSLADQDIGAPFKAISFHSHMENQGNLLQWEMIVDV